MSVFDRIGDKSEAIANKSKSQIVKEDVKKHITFSFETDESTLNYLKDQTLKLNGSMAKAYTEVGSILAETQKELANNKNGVFESWYKDLGFTKNQVYRWIYRYEFISFQNETIKNLIETLPITLSYEITNPNCPEELRGKVINGEIASLKEFNAVKNLITAIDVSKVEETSFVSIERIFESDIEVLDKNYKDFSKLLKEKFDSVPQEKKELLTKKIESINKEIEKLMKSF